MKRLFRLLSQLLVLPVGTKLISATPMMTWFIRRKKILKMLQVGKMYVCCQFIFNQLGKISASTTGTHSHQISPGKMMKRCKKDERIQNLNTALKDGIYLKRGPLKINPVLECNIQVLDMKLMDGGNIAQY